MGRVSTNNVGLSYTVESALGVPGTSWVQLEPNDITSFGATISKVARSPISTRRDRRKGVVTDLDSAVEFEADLTASAFTDFAEAFCFASAVNAELDIRSTAVAGSDYTVPGLSALQAGRLGFSAGSFASLVYARGFSNAANNGVKALAADPATSDTTITVTDTLVAETAPANAQLQLAGIRFLAGNADIVVTFAGGTLTITEQGNIAGFDWAAFGLRPGQVVHVGGVNASGGVANALNGGAANDTYGFARIRTVSPLVLTLDKVDATLRSPAPTTPATFDILFGKFLRNVEVDNAGYLERSFHIEASFPNLGTGGATNYQYSKGNYVNTIGISLPLTDKATMSVAMVGTDTSNPTPDRLPGASAARLPNATAAFGTSSDIARLRITELDEQGLGCCFKSLTLNINNNVTPEKCLGTLGARFINTGTFEVDVEAQLVFSEPAIIDAIRANKTLTMDFIVKNDDGAICFDIPALTLDGGDREFPVNESVLINTTAQAFRDDALGYSIGISIIPKVPVAR